MSISETAELYRKRSKLRFNNAKWNHQAVYSIYRSRGVKKLVIPVGITRSERVNISTQRIPLFVWAVGITALLLLSDKSRRQKGLDFPVCLVYLFMDIILIYQ